MKNITINLIQDIATPHNNVLIKHLNASEEVEVKLWYAQEKNTGHYDWKKDITHEICTATIYGKKLNWSFLKYCLKHSDERYVIVGWMNINTRLLHLLFFLLRRPYNHWTDLPVVEINGIGLKQRLFRWLAYKILKNSRAITFGVGKATLNYLKRRGFSDKQLVKLPIFVEVDEDLQVYRDKRMQILRNYSLNKGDFLLVSGSRLVYEKGFDLLINAIALLDDEIKKKVKLVIVGTGPCKHELEKLIEMLNLGGQVILEKWLDIADFKTLICNSNVFIHPARSDTYGGTTLGMAMGVAVIGSDGAGAALDRIEHGKNGFIYKASDKASLARLIELLFRDRSLCKLMGKQALLTSKAWHPDRGVKILIDNSK